MKYYLVGVTVVDRIYIIDGPFSTVEEAAARRKLSGDLVIDENKNIDVTDAWLFPWERENPFVYARRMQKKGRLDFEVWRQDGQGLSPSLEGAVAASGAHPSLRPFGFRSGQQVCVPEAGKSEEIAYFLLFAGDNYYAQGGWADLKGSFFSIQEAYGFLARAEEHYDWWHIVNFRTGLIVEVKKK